MPEPRPEPSRATEPILAPYTSRERGTERPGNKAFAVAAVLAVGLGAMVLLKSSQPPQPVQTAAPPAVETAIPAELPIDLVGVQPTNSGTGAQDAGNLVPYQESAQAELDKLAGMQRPQAQVPKPQLRRIADIYPVARRDERAGFRPIHLDPRSNVVSGARLDAAQDATSGVDSAGQTRPAPPQGSAPQRAMRSLAAQAGLPQCTRCGDGAVAYGRDPIAGSGKTIGAAKFIGMCGGAYAYEISNRSGSGYRATLTSQNGQAWDVDLPPGGSAIIKSGNALTGGLTGRQR